MQKHAFTMIELLVVISIIGIVVALSFFGIQNTRASSRDAKRKSDLETIRSVLELYKADCKEYPETVTSESSITGDAELSCAGNVYMDKVPADPIPDRDYQYISLDPFDTYSLCSSLETVDSGDAGSCDDCGSADCNYLVKNP